MPSRADVRRAAIEWLLRTVSIALLLVLLMRVLRSDLHSDPQSHATVIADPNGVHSALPAWTVTALPALHLKLASIPTPLDRDWLHALAHSGTSVTWEGDSLLPTAATVTRMVDPVPTWRAAVAMPRGSRIVLSDGAGLIDSISSAGNSGMTAILPDMVDRLGASAHGTTAWATVHDSAVLRRLLVEGSASWETKFAVAALQERGWTVDALTHVAPGVDIREGAPSRPDTARYAAVIAIDTSATFISDGAAAYVRSGGGLVTLHDAISIGPSGSRAVVLGKRADGTALTAYRSGQGRVLRVGYSDVWRSRMGARDSVTDPAASNRAWWGDVIASVAYAPRLFVRSDGAVDPAPLASMYDRVGPPSPGTHLTLAGSAGGIPSYVLFALLLVTLLLEWASRRLRGER
ncbi:MAG: hypothetical protein ACR2MQ_10035 [Gemmatimonadaceae bacterium]